MSIERIIAEVAVAKRSYSLRELCEICGIEDELLVELTSHGVITLSGDGPETWSVSEHDLLRSKKAIRLRNDLGIDWAGLALALNLLDEIERLRADLARHGGLDHGDVVDGPYSA